MQFFIFFRQLDEEAAGLLTDLQQSLNAVLDELSSTFANRYNTCP